MKASEQYPKLIFTRHVEGEKFSVGMVRIGDYMVDKGLLLMLVERWLKNEGKKVGSTKRREAAAAKNSVFGVDADLHIIDDPLNR